MHSLTIDYSYKLKITLTDFDGKKYDAVYDQFKVDQITQLLQIWSPSNQMNMIDGDICALFETAKSKPEHDECKNEVIMVENQINTKL